MAGVPVVARFEAVVSDRVESFNLNLGSEAHGEEAESEARDLIRTSLANSAANLVSTERQSEAVVARIKVIGAVYKDRTIRVEGHPIDAIVSKPPLASNSEVTHRLRILANGI